jgi:hypothetical protein
MSILERCDFCAAPLAVFEGEPYCPDCTTYEPDPYYAARLEYEQYAATVEGGLERLRWEMGVLAGELRRLTASGSAGGDDAA